MKTLIEKLLLVIFIILFSSCGEENYSIKSSISGIIIEATDNTPIEGAIVTNMSTGKNLITGTDGYYEFSDLSFGKTYKIYVEKEGYIPSTHTITPTEVRDNIELNIRLSKKP